MSKVTKIALILIGAGILLCGLAIFMVRGVWTEFNSKGNDTVEKTYESKAGITKIVLDESANDIIVKSDDTDIVTIEYYDDPNAPVYEIEEKNGELKFERNDRTVFKLINIDFSQKQISVTIPKNYSGELELELTSGKMTLTDVTASDIELDNTSGSIILENVASSGNIDIDNTSGSIEFTNLSAKGDIKLDNTAGSIEGTIDGKQSDFSITSDVTAGSTNLPTTTGGKQKLEAENTAGSIEIQFTK